MPELCAQWLQLFTTCNADVTTIFCASGRYAGIYFASTAQRAKPRGRPKFFLDHLDHLREMGERVLARRRPGMIKAGCDAPPFLDRWTMGNGQYRRSKATWTAAQTGRQNLHRRRTLPSEDRNSVARSARTIRLLEDRLQPFLELVAARSLGNNLQSAAT